MSFAKLDAHCRSLEALEHALSILGVDEATAMASGGGEKRAEAMAALSGMYHRQATDPNVRDWIEDSQMSKELDEGQPAAVRELERSYINATCLPSEFVERQTITRMRCEQLWRTARSAGDWAGFAPALEGVVALVREEADMRAEVLKLAPYDALMEQYDPGNRVADIDPVFADLKAVFESLCRRGAGGASGAQGKAHRRPISPALIRLKTSVHLALR